MIGVNTKITLFCNFVFTPPSNFVFTSAQYIKTVMILILRLLTHSKFTAKLTVWHIVILLLTTTQLIHYTKKVMTAEKHKIQFIGYDMYISRILIVTY